MPAAQGVQPGDAVAAEEVPATQGEHELAPPPEYFPAGQDAHELLTEPANLPAAQLSHPTEEPSPAANEPAPQAVQPPALAAEKVPEGQARQVAEVVAEEAAEKRPAAQSTHAELPEVGW